MNSLPVAIGAFLVLGVLAWTTLSDPKIRLMTLSILAMFAFKTWLRRRQRPPVGDQGEIEALADETEVRSSKRKRTNSR